MSEQIVDVKILKEKISFVRSFISEDPDLLLRSVKNNRFKNRLVAVEILLQRANNYLLLGFASDALKYYTVSLLVLRKVCLNCL